MLASVFSVRYAAETETVILYTNDIHCAIDNYPILAAYRAQLIDVLEHGARVVRQEGLPCDSEMLIEYFTETLDGKITDEKYGNPDGDGRITLVDTKAPDDDPDPEPEPEEPCNHICHSENAFMNFIWNIGNFFHKIFGICAVCDCGEYHYSKK